MLKKTVIAAAILAATTSLAFANGGTFVPVETKGAQLDSGYYLGVGVDGNFYHYNRSNNWDHAHFTPELFAGYGVNWTNKLYTGFELFGYASGYKSYNYGARFMPGVKIFNNTIAFGNIGFVRGYLYPQPLVGWGTSQKQANGIQFGAGVQTKLADNVSLRGGWNRNYFSAYGVHPKADQFYLSAIYHFTV